MPHYALTPATDCEFQTADHHTHPIEYIHHESFENPAMEAEILGPAPAASKRRLAKAPSDLPAYLASLYEIPLLTPEQEAYYFRKLNYLKYRAVQLRQRRDVSQASNGDLARFEEWLRQADDVRNLLIQSNLRLVVALVRKWGKSGSEFFELLSDGNMSLIRAIEKFDVGRGFRFSTFATRVISNDLLRSVPAEQARRRRLPTCPTNHLIDPWKAELINSDKSGCKTSAASQSEGSCGASVRENKIF